MNDLEKRISAIEDRLAIYDLIASHSFSVDVPNASYTEAAHTADSVFDRGGALPGWSGRDSIVAATDNAEMRAARKAGFATVKSFPSVEINGDKATAYTYNQIIVPDTGHDAALVAGHGMSTGFRIHRITVNRWELVREQDGWKIRSRINRLVGTAEAAEIIGRWRYAPIVLTTP